MARLLLALLCLIMPRLAVAGCAPVAMGEARVWLAAGEPEVTVTFLGHASFLIESPGGVRAVTDYSGMYSPAEPPDIVTMNHAHSSHFTLHPDPRIPHVLHGWQEGAAAPSYDLVVRDMRVTNLPTNIRDWGGGTEVNGNSVFIFETGGLCIAHLGHLHHLLEPADLDALGRIDVLMVAVDGGYTLSQQDIQTVIGQIHPRVVLPMHYFTRENLARFLDRMRDAYTIEVRETPEISFSRLTLPERPTVMALPARD